MHPLATLFGSCLFTLAVLAALPVQAHTPSSYSESAPATTDHIPLAGDHDHKVWAYANLASPVNGASYSQTYMSGSLPISSGSMHKVVFSSTLGSDYVSIDWEGIVDGVNVPYANDQPEWSSYSTDEYGFFERIFNIYTFEDLSQLSTNVTYGASAAAAIADETFSPPLESGAAIHSHEYTIY